MPGSSSIGDNEQGQLLTNLQRIEQEQSANLNRNTALYLINHASYATSNFAGMY